MSIIAKRIHDAFDSLGWVAKGFEVAFVVDKVERTSDTHEVDHYKTQVAVETEWNSKDSVFDRDLKSFRLLHDLGIISVGVVITRSTSLQGAFDKIPFGVGEKYGPSTTHTAKLIEEIKAGTGGNCPILVFGITERCYIDEPITSTNLAFIEAEYNDKLARKSRRALRNNPR